MILVKPLDPPQPRTPETRHVLVGPRGTGAERAWMTQISTGHSHPLLLTVGSLTSPKSHPQKETAKRQSQTEKSI